MGKTPKGIFDSFRTLHTIFICYTHIHSSCVAEGCFLLLNIFSFGVDFLRGSIKFSIPWGIKLKWLFDILWIRFFLKQRNNFKLENKIHFELTVLSFLSQFQTIFFFFFKIYLFAVNVRDILLKKKKFCFAGQFYLKLFWILLCHAPNVL